MREMMRGEAKREKTMDGGKVIRQVVVGDESHGRREGTFLVATRQALPTLPTSMTQDDQIR